MKLKIFFTLQDLEKSQYIFSKPKHIFLVEFNISLMKSDIVILVLFWGKNTIIAVQLLGAEEMCVSNLASKLDEELVS